VKLLIYPHRLEIGGSQINAIDLAAAMRERGHDVLVFAQLGPAAALVEERGLRLVPAPAGSPSPSFARARALSALAAAERVDLVHAWDWPQCIDALHGVTIRSGIPVLGSIMSMSFPRFLPRHVSFTAGTEETVAAARRMGVRHVHLLEPPVDERNRPGAVDVAPFRERFGLDDDALHVVVVSRLVEWMKQDGLHAAVDAVADISTSARPVRLVIVGEGKSAPELAQRADAVNRRLGRRAIVLTGPLLDPRPAYALADVVLGQGSSILRAMAFGVPTVVVGVEGFCAPVDPVSFRRFAWHGFYGRGVDAGRGPLRDVLGALLEDPARRAELGAYGRGLVARRYGIGPISKGLEALYEGVVARPLHRGGGLVDGARSGAHRLGLRVLPPSALDALRGWGTPAPQSFGRVG
jgi:glycosyltransferase involved in cell wall biosynthesis